MLSNNKSRKKLQSENEEFGVKAFIEEKELSELRKTLSADEFRQKAIEFDKKVSDIRLNQGKKEEILNDQKFKKREAEFFQENLSNFMNYF